MGLNDLSTAPIKDEVDFANLPEQFGGINRPPQPGPYLWEVSPLSADSFDVVKTEQYGERVSVKFDAKAPLVIKQSVGGLHDGEPFQTRISNVPRARNKEKTVFASDWDYLNQALGFESRPASNKAYAQMLLEKSKSRPTFRADIEWSYHCDAKRPAQFLTESGLQEIEENGTKRLGCGQRYYQNDVPKVTEEGAASPTQPYRIQCQCGASVRAFANLVRFKKP